MCARTSEANRDNQSMNRRHLHILNFLGIHVQYCPLSQIMEIQHGCTEYTKKEHRKHCTGQI